MISSSYYPKLYLTSLNFDSACDFRCVGTRSGWDSITILLYAAFTCIAKMRVESGSVYENSPQPSPVSTKIQQNQLGNWRCGAAQDESHSFGSSERDGNQGRTSEGEGREKGGKPRSSMASLLLIVPCRCRPRLLRRREAGATAAGRCLVRRHARR